MQRSRQGAPLKADSDARAVTPTHPGLEEKSNNGSQTVQTVIITQESVMEQKAPVMEPMVTVQLEAPVMEHSHGTAAD